MNPTAQLLQPEIRELITEHRYAELREALHGLQAADTADILGELEPWEAALGFRFLPRDDAGEVFAYLPPEKQEELIQELGNEAAARVVEAMNPDDRVKVLDELPPEVAQRLVGSLSPETRRATQAILGYPPESVGRLMTPDYISVRPDWTIAQTLDHIRKCGRDAETINVIYVTDAHGKLIDDLRLRQILLTEPAELVRSIMNDEFTALSAADDQEEAVRLMGRYDRTALPVVDSRGVLLGIVTIDDVVDVAQEEATEDIQQLGGVAALERSYMQTGQREMLQKRGVWLSALFLGQTVTILVLSAFSEQLERAVVLMLFVPLVISCGGNSGSQAATLLTRALALQEIRPRDWFRIVRKEVITGLLLGAGLGLLGVSCVLFWGWTGLARTDHPWLLAIAVGSAILGVVVWGTILGSLLPLALKKVGFDPAVASSPMVATLMDASGMIIYFAVAIVVLGGSVL